MALFDPDTWASAYRVGGLPAVIGVGILLALWVVWAKCRPHIGRIDLHRRFRLAQQVNEALGVVAFDIGADRVYIMQYHNGGVNTAGVAFDRVSCTHEQVQLGVAPMLPYARNLPGAMLASLNVELASRKEAFAPNVSDLRGADPVLHHCLADVRAAKSAYVIAIEGFRGRPIGFLVAEYCRERRDLTGQEIRSFRASALKICGLLLAEKRRWNPLRKKAATHEF